MMVLYSIIGWIGLFAVFFGLEIVALLILFIAWRYARQLVFVLLCGGVAAVLMAIESFAWFAASGPDPLRGTSGITVIFVCLSVISIVSLGFYFPAAIRRCERSQTSTGRAGSDPSRSSAKHANEYVDEPEDLIWPPILPEIPFYKK